MSVQALPLRDHFVYRLFSADNVLLYVGCTVSVTTRLADHRRTKPWWATVVRVEQSTPMTQRDAYKAESDAIATERPRHNVARPDGNVQPSRTNVTDLDQAIYYGLAEIARLLGVSRQRVSQLTARADFPEPVMSLAMGKVWSKEDVQRWAKETGRIK